MKAFTIGPDIAKSVFQGHGADAAGKMHGTRIEAGGFAGAPGALRHDDGRVAVWELDGT